MCTELEQPNLIRFNHWQNYDLVTELATHSQSIAGETREILDWRRAAIPGKLAWEIEQDRRGKNGGWVKQNRAKMVVGRSCVWQQWGLPISNPFPISDPLIWT